MTIDGYCTIGIDREYDLSPDDLIRHLDKAEVDRAVIAPPDRFLAVKNRLGNESVKKAYLTFPERFIPTCSANPWYGPSAVEEVRRSINEGARILVISPAVQGFMIDDEIIFPLAEAAVNEKIPIYVHTGNPQSATPLQIGLLAQQFPGADWIIGHAGATDFWNDVAEAVKMNRNIYIESSFSRPFLFKNHCKLAGFDRGIMGSGASINPLVFEWNQMRNELPEKQYSNIYGSNLEELLKKRGSR